MSGRGLLTLAPGEKHERRMQSAFLAGAPAFEQKIAKNRTNH
jgi:hypothetical protein